MVNTRRRRFIAALSTGALLSTGAVTGAGEDTTQSESEGGSQSQDEPTDELQFNHFSSDAPEVGVTIEGPSETVLDRTFGTLTDLDQYAPYEPGQHSVTITNAESGDRILSEEIDLAGGPYTLSLIGEHCKVAKRPLRLGVFEDDHSPLEDGMARVRSIHVMPDAPAVDVTVNEQTVMEALEFGEAQTVDVPAGNATMSIYPSDGGDKIVKFRLDPEEGVIYTVGWAGYRNVEDAPNDAKVKKAAPGVLIDKMQK